MGLRYERACNVKCLFLDINSIVEETFTTLFSRRICGHDFSLNKRTSNA